MTPFHPEYNDTFEIIRGVSTKAGFECLRGDERFVEGDLLSHILRLIVTSRIIVANIEGRNPNVFYELGIAHALGKPVLLVSKSVEELPFDLRYQRILIYRNNNELRSKFEISLLQVLADKI